MEIRSESFGQNHQLTFVDKLGIWMSTRRIVRLIKQRNVKSMADIGCGFNAQLSQLTRDLVSKSVLVDVALRDDLKNSPDYESYTGTLPGVLNSLEKQTLDLIVFNAVLEHLDEPIETLRELKLILAPNGVLFINVPSWFGKRILEFFAFKLSLSPAEEMEDHRRYYNKRELWLEIRAAGFMPSKIKIRRHKFMGALFAVVES